MKRFTYPIILQEVFPLQYGVSTIVTGRERRELPSDGESIPELSAHSLFSNLEDTRSIIGIRPSIPILAL